MKIGRLLARSRWFAALATVTTISLLGVGGAGADNLPPRATPADKV